MKKILDACCGSGMFWFDKNNPDVIFADNREKETPWASATNNTCVIGTAGTGKNRFFMIPEILAAMNEDKNLFVILDGDKEDFDKIKEKAKETGHEVFIDKRENPRADRFEEIFQKKHIIVYQADKLNRGGMTLSLALEQYLCILFNVKAYYPLEHRDKRKYEVVIDEFLNTIHFDIAPRFAVARKYDLSFVYSIASIEQLRDNEPDYRCLLACTPFIYIMGFRYKR